jgi:murein DD-endopeptidase MepM/ murein hydrolase activator NlpD
VRRLAAVGGVALLLPVLAWRAVGADPQTAELVPCDATMTTGSVLDPLDPAMTASTQACDPVDPLAPVPPTPPVVPPPPSLPGESTTTTTIFDPNTTTTTLDPNATTTTTTTPPVSTDPGTTLPPTDTAPPPSEPPTSEPPPTEPPTSEPPPVEETVPPETTVPAEVESATVTPSPAPEAGRVLAPTGVTETGQVRSITFPVAGPVRYSNDFGACRAGCSRQHKGNDIIGDRLQPLLAMRDGVVDRLLDHPTAGYGVVIQDAEGWEYHIYHVNNDSPGTDDGADDGSWRFAPGIFPGAPVKAGQVVAWMGDSGNSEGSVPHAHVEIHTPSGAAVNPFWSLRMAQRDVNCAIPTIVDPAGASDPAIAALAAPDPDATFLQDGWSAPQTLAALPGEWRALSVTGGRPGSATTAARMWIGPAGYTPVDEAAVQVGDPRYNQDCTQPIQAPAQIPAELGAILATIRAMETGGNYTTQVTSSTASGAYGFLDSSWGGYGGYRRARDAPPEVQDAKAAELATYILNRNNGDVSTVPVSWYIGHVPIGAEWDTVPPVGANTITPREYQSRWLRMYARILGQPEAWVGTTPAWTAVDTSATCRTVVVDLGQPGQPEYGLTQAHMFGTDGSGRAVAAAGDPCDPNRPAPAQPPTDTPTLPAEGPN